MTSALQQRHSPLPAQAAGNQSRAAAESISGICVRVGQVWEVFDRTERYPAQVVGFNADRVAIRRVCAANVTATPTYARWGMFTDTSDGYTFLDWAKP